MKERHIFLYSFGLLSLVLGFQIYLAIHQNGMFCYPIDDSYIHMAIAKNISQHGMWGITRFEFSSASSSILYSLVLAFLFFIFGINLWIPLIVNWVCSACIIYFLAKWSIRYLSVTGSLVFCMCSIFLIPLTTLTLMGMEHTLHILFCLIFMYQSFEMFSDFKVKHWRYFLVAVLIVGFRYEGVFLIGITALVWIFIRRRIYIGVYLILAIIIPISIFGIYSILHGGYFLPNTLMIKGVDGSHSIAGFVSGIMKKFFNGGLIYSLLFLPCIYLFLVPGNKGLFLRNRPVQLLFIILTATCLAHFILARFGRPYRYEAYLVAMTLMMVPPIWKPFLSYMQNRALSTKIIFISLSFIYLLPVLFRLGITFNDNLCIRNIRGQQVSMALFIQKFFPHTTVALNDIGAVAFYNDDVHIFDMVGLANMDVLKYHTKEDTSFLKVYTAKANVEIGLFYPDWIGWLGYKMPKDWEQLGNWHLNDNYIAGNADVGIFSIDSSVRDTLESALKSYAKDLPSNVVSRESEPIK